MVLSTPLGTHHPIESHAVLARGVELWCWCALGVWLDVFPRPPCYSRLGVSTTTLAARCLNGKNMTILPESAKLTQHPTHKLKGRISIH